MGKFSKIFKHIESKDLRNKYEQKVFVQKLESEIIEAEKKEIKEKFEKIKSNWRAIGFDLKPKSVTENKKTKRKSFKKIMKEAMRTSSIMQKTETETVDVSDIDLTNPVSYANSITSSAGLSFISTTGSQYNQGAGIATNGAGVPGGGFNLGSDYLAFAFPPTQEAPTFGRADFGAQDLTNVDTISAFGIRGNITNGGSTPLVGGGITEPGLRLQYKLSGMGTYRDFNIKPDGSIDNSVENILIPGGIATDSFTAGKNIVVNIPSYIKTAQTEIRLITKDIGFHGTPVYGVKNFKFQRRTPQNVFVALDDPEAMSFIRVGQQPSVKRKSAKEREEDVVNLLKGGRDYTNKILGMQFPGSNPELSFSTDLPDQDIADIQQQQRSQTFNQIKDRFASDPGIDGRIQTLRATQSPTSQISYQDYNNFETYASVMPSYETSIVNINQAFDDFADENGQQLSGGNDELIDDVKSRSDNVEIDYRKPILTPEKGAAVYADEGSIEDLLKSPHETGFKKVYISPSGEAYKLAMNVRDANGKSILDAQYKVIDKAMRQATDDYNKAMMDARYEMGVAYYKQSVESQIKNFEKLTPRQQARRTRPRYNEAQAKARGKNYQKYMPSYNPENITDPLIKSYHQKFGTEEARDFLRPFYEAQEALNNKIVRVDNQAPYGLYKGGLRDNPNADIVLPFTGKTIPTAAKREKQIDDLFKELESGESAESGSDLGYKSADEILADVGDQWTYDEYINQMKALSDKYAKIAEPLEKIKLDYIYNKNKTVPIGIVDKIDSITQSLFGAQEALYQAWMQYNKAPDLSGEGEGEESKPQGLARVVAGLADLATGQKFDFDKRGNIDLNLVKTKDDLPKNIVVDAMAKLARKATSGYSLPVDLTLKYALGDNSPVTKSPGKGFNQETLKTITTVHKPGTTKGKVTESDYGKTGAYSGGNIAVYKQGLVQGAFNNFNYEVTPKGIRIDDRFNFDDPKNPSSTTIGGLRNVMMIPGTEISISQIIATNLVKIGDLRARLAGKDPRDDKNYGPKIDYVIPKNQLTKQQRDLFYGRDSVYELEPGVVSKKKVNESSTYNRIKNKFFNQNDIKPTFPENPPPEMVNGLHPEYGKRANRYKKLDPISANSMPLTGDPEIDAVVKKQKTFKKFKKSMKNK